jgi:hypothetical protein
MFETLSYESGRCNLRFFTQEKKKGSQGTNGRRQERKELKDEDMK